MDTGKLLLLIKRLAIDDPEERYQENETIRSSTQTKGWRCAFCGADNWREGRYFDRIFHREGCVGVEAKELLDRHGLL